MIVLGADTHKSSHTVAAINTATGQVPYPLEFRQEAVRLLRSSGRPVPQLAAVRCRRDQRGRCRAKWTFAGMRGRTRRPGRAGWVSASGWSITKSWMMPR
jgi:hypothetical protein